MANTYSQVYLHFIFTVKGKISILPKKNKEELHKYITGLIQHRKNKLLAINSVGDHMHILVGFSTLMTMSDFMEEIKALSSRFINSKTWIPGRFEWQKGYGVFSYSRSQIDTVIKYIANQEEHHKTMSFKEEYIKLLKEFSIEYDEKYLFDWIE